MEAQTTHEPWLDKSSTSWSAVFELLYSCFSEPGPMRQWLDTPNPKLDDRNSRELILEGNWQEVLRILENAASRVSGQEK
jgi:tRNA uridine 5-carbamoylmethylation protein Kti12